MKTVLFQDEDKSDIEKDDDLELDDEDLDLLNDNLDIQQRPAGSRVVIESDDEEDAERTKRNIYDGVKRVLTVRTQR